MVMQGTKRSGSLYFNYKGAHRIVLMAVWDSYNRIVIVPLWRMGEVVLVKHLLTYLLF